MRRGLCDSYSSRLGPTLDLSYRFPLSFMALVDMIVGFGVCPGLARTSNLIPQPRFILPR